eukprot:CAMPEP_0113694656 /NCGR_PEP_ID=MMETSP0038_2-20120614/20427_1 /TAXON_ID=2898 /ORGANISM="Cryptomonas paramecium" /LENGTH=252 /DNA_ID=CAMNT_0000617035 /DNA_START=91 /DNA_END=845 /DNA_ORIENTATION=- /assembly_acc=CAM_ASM_000170
MAVSYRKGDAHGWQKYSRMIVDHSIQNFKPGMSIEDKIRAMKSLSGDVEVMGRDLKSEPLVVSAQRNQFFDLVDEGKVFVRNGTLFGFPPALPKNVWHLPLDELSILAKQCGVAKNQLQELDDCRRIAGLLCALASTDKLPVSSKLNMLPRVELIRLCRRFDIRGDERKCLPERHRDLVKHLLRLRWRGLNDVAIARAAQQRLGHRVSGLSIRSALRWLEHDDAMKALVRRLSCLERSSLPVLWARIQARAR